MSHPKVAQLYRGVIVEFDFAVLSGHALLVDVCRARLETEGVTFDASLLARSMGGRSLSSGINALCSKQGKTVDLPTVVADCNAELTEKLAGELSKIPESFLKFVKAALAKDLRVVIVTRLESETVLPALGIEDERLTVLHDLPNGFGFNTWEGWRRAARKSNLHDRLCVAIAGSGFSVKGAINSGMFVFVKPNALTEHQDFSGCDTVIAEYAASHADDMTRLLRV